MAAEADDFKLTKEEADQLREALKKEEFRKLLKEYAEEISDPVNKQRYEEDIKKLESERGMDVQFVKIKPKLVVKTTKLPSRQKLFINIGECDLVGVAKPVQDRLPNGKVGSRWSIPYTVTQPREDTDNGKKCSIIDIGFHSLTMSNIDKDHRFLDLIITTAIEGVEKDRGIKVDHKHVKRMKFEYKGTPQSTVIRKKKPASPSLGSDTVNVADGSGVAAQQDPQPFKFPYPPMKEEREKDSTKQLKKEKQLSKKPNNEPAYTIVHRGEFDMQDYTFTPISSSVKRPRELIVTVKLPKLESAGTVELDIFEKRLILINKKPSYHLELNLSYPVNEDLARAKFDKSTRSLIITLPVLPPTTPIPPHPHMTKPHPFIEPLSNDESSGNDEPNTTTHVVNEPEPIKSTVRSDWSINDSWECPPFSYCQNDECVSLVLHVAFVKENTLISYFDQDSFQVTFKGSVDSSIDVLKSYSIYVQLIREEGMDESGPIIDTSNCKVDISAENVVVVVAKGPEQLQRFKVGPGPVKLTEKLFVTDSNVLEVCELLDTMDTWKGQITEDLSVNLVQTGEEESVVEIVTKEQSPPTNPVTVEIDKSVTTNGIEAHQQVIDSGKEMILKVNDGIVQNEPEGTKGEGAPTSNGCGFNGTPRQDANKFVKFSNDLLYDLD